MELERLIKSLSDPASTVGTPEQTLNGLLAALDRFNI